MGTEVKESREHPSPGLGKRSAAEEEAAWLRTMALGTFTSFKYGLGSARAQAMLRQAVRRTALMFDSRILEGYVNERDELVAKQRRLLRLQHAMRGWFQGGWPPRERLPDRDPEEME
jgi:hypothetical protein